MWPAVFTESHFHAGFTVGNINDELLTVFRNISRFGETLRFVVQEMDENDPKRLTFSFRSHGLAVHCRKTQSLEVNPASTRHCISSKALDASTFLGDSSL